MPVLTRLFFLLAILMCWPGVAAAQQTNLTPSLRAEGPVPTGGGEVMLAIRFDTDPPWHGYWKNPGDAGLPLQVDWTLPDGAFAGELQFPTPERLEVAGLMSFVYKDDHAVLVPVTIPAPDSDSVTISASMRWLACTDKVCVPERGEVSLVLPVGRGGGDPDFDQYRRALPAPLASDAAFRQGPRLLSIALPIPADLDFGEPQLFLAEPGIVDESAEPRFRRMDDMLIADLPVRANANEEGRLSGVLKLEGGRGLSFEATPGDVPSGGAIVADRSTGAVLWALGGALLGGLLLNLMPCVFPVLAMKALHLAKAGASENYARRDALGYTLGAVLGTASLGLLLLVLRAGGEAVGWAFQLQDPRTIFVLLILAGGIFYNLIGLFELPVLAGSVEAKGSVATGALAAFVATPCAGPFLGTALGTALILPPVAAVGVFAALGLGLALPFLIIGFVPPLRRRLPAPGAWMEKLKRFLAIPMALTVIACLWLLWRLAGPLGLAGGVFALGLLATILGFFARRVGMLRTAAAMTVALAAAGVLTLPARAVERSERIAGANAFNPAAIEAARAAGRPVFVYFTADWCLTCKANEAVAIDREEVLDAFDRADVAIFVADWTDGDARITRALEERGRAAVPLYLWYLPGAEEAEELPQLLTPAMLTGRAELAQSARAAMERAD